MSRLRIGELVAAAGAAGLFFLMFLDWFQSPIVRLGAGFRPVDALHTSGWGSLGWFLVVLIVLMIAATAIMVLVTARQSPVALPVAANVLTAFFAILVFVVLLLRVVTQPGLGAGAPNHLVEVEPAAYLGLLCALAVAVGSWIAMADDRTDAPESAYTPPPPRPAPPPEADAVPGS